MQSELFKDVFNKHITLQDISSWDMAKKKVGNYVIDKSEELGSGQYGKVYKAIHFGTNEPVAAKVIDKQAIATDDYTKNALMRETEIMMTVNSPNIIRCLEVHETKNNIYIFQELANSGSLKSYISKHEKVNEQEALDLIAQMVRGFSELTSHGIIHRDIKPGNILLKDKTLKLADFGFARYSETLGKINSAVGTPIYMAPQVLNQAVFDSYSYKCDIWSFGIVSYEILTGDVPWTIKSENLEGLYKEVEAQSKSGIVFPPEIKVSKELKHLISGCLKFYEKDRYNWTQILHHPALKNYLDKNETSYNESSLQLAFALTSIRISIHSQNLNVNKLLSFTPEQMDYETFSTIIKVLDPNISANEINIFFKTLAEKEFMTKTKLLDYFKSHGIKLEGLKLSEISPDVSINDFEGVQKIIQEIALTLEQKNIEITQLFHQYGGKKQYMKQQEFHKMISSIKPGLSSDQLHDIFLLFDTKKLQQVNLKECNAKLCKMIQVPRISDSSLRESMKNMKIDQKKKSLK